MLKIVLSEESYPKDFFEKILHTTDISEISQKIEKSVEKIVPKLTPAKRKWSKQSKNVDILNNLNIDSRYFC